MKVGDIIVKRRTNEFYRIAGIMDDPISNVMGLVLMRGIGVVMNEKTKEITVICETLSKGYNRIGNFEKYNKVNITDKYFRL